MIFAKLYESLTFNLATFCPTLQLSLALNLLLSQLLGKETTTLATNGAVRLCLLQRS